MRTIALFCLLACGSCQPVSETLSNDMGGLVVNDPNPAPQNRNGSRLKLQYAVTEFEDGTKILSSTPTYFDIKLNTVCNTYPLEDMIKRCVPINNAFMPDWYADAQCKEPVAFYNECVAQKPEYITDLVNNPIAGKCGTTFNYYQVYRAGSDITDRKGLFLKEGPACRAVTEPELDIYKNFNIMRVGAKMAPTEFVAVTTSGN